MELQSALALDIEPFFDHVRTIPYGYQDRNGALHFDGDPDFHDHEYRFSAPTEVIENNCGWCWDAANLIALYCRHHGIAHVTLFLEYRAPELHQTHTQVFLKLDTMWYPAPDNSAVFSLGAGGRESYEACRDNYADTFREYLRHVLQERYDETKLLLKAVTVPIPGGITDEEYLALVRNC